MHGSNPNYLVAVNCRRQNQKGEKKLIASFVTELELELTVYGRYIYSLINTVVSIMYMYPFIRKDEFLTHTNSQ